MAKVKIFFDVHTFKTISPLLTYLGEWVQRSENENQGYCFCQSEQIYWKSSMMVSGLNTRTQDSTPKQEDPELASPISKERKQADLSTVSTEDP